MQIKKTKFKGEFEERLKSVISEVQNSNGDISGVKNWKLT